MATEWKGWALLLLTLGSSACASQVARGQQSGAMAAQATPLTPRPGTRTTESDTNTATGAPAPEQRTGNSAAAAGASSRAPAPPSDGTEPHGERVATGGEDDLALASDSEQPPTLIHPIPLYDPSGQAMAPFHAALRRIESEGATVRIAFFGASHVASDLFTDLIRKRLQLRFGDAGPGFVSVGKPWRWHRHGSVTFPRTRHFKPLRVLARAPKRDHYGLAGVALESRRLRATARIATRPREGLDGRVDHIELYYLKQPGGGRARILIDGKGAGMIRTAERQRQPGYRAFEVPLSNHTLEVRTQADGPVRLFGAVLEKKGPGVVLDTLGIPGSRARNHLYWDDGLYRAHLSRRPGDLWVLAYGTNESGDDDVPIELYEERGRKVMTRLRELMPHAACLLIGPSDRPIREEREGGEEGLEVRDRPRTLEIVAAQKRLSAEFGCGFFDMVAFMGGPLSMLNWVAAKPSLGAPDHIHFTRRGYEALGQAVYDAMLEGFDSPASVADAAPPNR